MVDGVKTSKFPRPGRRALLAPVVIAAVALFAAACSSSSSTADDGPHELTGVVRTPPAEVGEVALPVATDPATSLNFRADPGGLLVVYFGYTSCPDICPTTLADLKGAIRQMEAPSSKVDVAVATVDPRRDSATVIEGYVTSFFPDATALRTEDDAALRAVTDAFGATYKVEYPNNAEPRVAHSAYLYAIDENGRVVVAWPFGSTAADMAADLDALLARA